MSNSDHEKNRAAWNQMVDLHINHPEYRTQEVIDGGNSLKRIELETLGDVTGKKLLHLMCQFGLDTISWARHGAIVTGVDISDRSIEVANEIKQRADVKARFIRSDIFALDDKLNEQFDIVFQSYGTHIWLADIKRWGQVVAKYLKPGGTFFIVDEHPANVMFMGDDSHSYFKKGPIVSVNPTDYCETETRIDGEHVEFQHTVSDILNALIEAGLRIAHVGEYDFGYYKVCEGWTERGDHYWDAPEGPTIYPVILSVKAVKD